MVAVSARSVLGEGAWSRERGAWSQRKTGHGLKKMEEDDFVPDAVGIGLSRGHGGIRLCVRRGERLRRDEKDEV